MAWVRRILYDGVFWSSKVTVPEKLLWWNESDEYCPGVLGSSLGRVHIYPCYLFCL